jgi:hypothetical protein
LRSDGFDHSAIFLMASLGRWIMELVGFPTEGSLCILLSGGSSATLNALTTARHRAAARDGWNMRTEGLQSGRKRLIPTAARRHADPEVPSSSDRKQSGAISRYAFHAAGGIARGDRRDLRPAACRSPSSPAVAPPFRRSIR